MFPRSQRSRRSHSASSNNPTPTNRKPKQELGVPVSTRLWLPLTLRWRTKMMHISPTVVELRKEPAAPEKKWQRVWVNGKLLAVAIAIELIIVGAVLFASYQ